MQKRKSRAYYQYMLDVCDQRVGYYSTDDVANIVYDLLDDGDEQEALAACQKGLDQHPGDEFVLIVKAKVLVRMHRYDEAEHLLKGNPDEQSPFGISIRFGIDLKQNGAVEALQRLMADYEAQRLTTQEMVDIADEYFDDVQHLVLCPILLQLAQSIDNEATSDDGQKAETLGRIGALLMDCHCHSEAISVLEKALDVDAYDVYSWQDLTRCQFELKRMDECEQSCEMGLAIDPQHPLFNFLLGYIRCEQMRYDEAIACLELTRAYTEGRLQHENINLDRQEAEQQRFVMYEMLAIAYQNVEKTEKAIECYSILVQRQPRYSEGFERLAMLYSETGQMEQALLHADIAIRLEPDNKEFLALHASLNTQMRHFEAALDDLDRLIEIDPRSKTYLLAKAELSLSIQRFDDADTAYRRLLKLRPNDEASRRMMREYFESIGDEEALKQL